MLLDILKITRISSTKRNYLASGIKSQARIRNYIHINIWDIVTNDFPRFNGICKRNQMWMLRGQGCTSSGISRWTSAKNLESEDSHLCLMRKYAMPSGENTSNIWRTVVILVPNTTSSHISNLLCSSLRDLADRRPLHFYGMQMLWYRGRHRINLVYISLYQAGTYCAGLLQVQPRYIDMGVMASEIIGRSIVCSTVCSG